MIDRKVCRPVAERLGHLAKSPDAALARAAHLLEIDLHGNNLLGGIGLVQLAAIGIEHRRLAIAARPQSVDVEHISLHHGAGRMCHRQVDIAVDGMRHHRMQDHFRPHGGERTRCFGEPDVIAVENAETPGTLDIPDEKVFARCDTLFQRREREHFGIAPDHLAIRIDD